VDWQLSSATELELVALVEAELENQPAPATSDAAGDWLCAWCLNRVANERDRFEYDGRSQFTFSNPEGIRFEIITFSRTLGCQQAGKPILEHTWFPGHAWSYCQCDSCSQHLGWYYTGTQEFAGLILNRIVRASCVRN
jgi:hypothetical protein